jgi:hypothetical protein
MARDFWDLPENNKFTVSFYRNKNTGFVSFIQSADFICLLLQNGFVLKRQFETDSKWRPDEFTLIHWEFEKKDIN